MPFLEAWHALLAFSSSRNLHHYSAVFLILLQCFRLSSSGSAETGKEIACVPNGIIKVITSSTKLHACFLGAVTTRTPLPQLVASISNRLFALC